MLVFFDISPMVFSYLYVSLNLKIMAHKPSKPVHDAGKTLSDPRSTKKDKELAAKVLSDIAHKKKGR